MVKLFKIKPIINKKNGQINFSLPRKKLSKKILKDLKLNPYKKFMIRLEGFE